jgi:predicted DNA-binding protein (UPF0251 family)/predicted Fe-Mo cluster-binding NifX family protein
MPRPYNPRRVGFLPQAIYFKPSGVRMADLEEIILGNDELEAIRLKDLLGLSQDEAAREMNISQPTFHRLVLIAHQKIADAFINGKAVRIEGGNIHIREGFAHPCHWRRRWGCKLKVQCEEGANAVPVITQGGKVMKIAITSTDGTLEGMVDERFGRSRKLIIYDRENKSHEVIDNMQNMNAPQGAGIQSAQNVVNSGATTVISGHLGPNAFRVLQSAGVEVYTASNMPVSEAIGAFEEGKLAKLTGPDVGGHW